MIPTLHLTMVEIKKLEPNKRNMLKFIKFQLDLYKDNPYFVPPLVLDESTRRSPRLS